MPRIPELPAVVRKVTPCVLAGMLLCLLPAAAALPSADAAVAGTATVQVDPVMMAPTVPPMSGAGATADGAAHAVDDLTSPVTDSGALEGLGATLREQGLDVGAPLEQASTGVPALRAGPLPGEGLATPEARVAAGVGAAAGLAMAAGLRPFLALAPLYARLDRNALLEHPVRRELMRRIETDPGVNVSDLHVGLDLGWGSLLYHLQRLEGQGLVMSHRWGRSRRYFLNQRGLSTRAGAIRVLKAPNARTLATMVTEQPGRTQEELAQAMALSKSVVSKYAKRLAEAGLVQREVGRNCLRLFPTAELRELLHTMPAPHPVTVAAPGPAQDRERPVGPAAPPNVVHRPHPVGPHPAAPEPAAALA